MRITLLTGTVVLMLASLAEAQPATLRFLPTVYYNNFSHKYPPALRVNVGDTVRSESVDAVGFDRTGNQIARRGNPVTGPFYITNAKPGDILAVTLVSVTLNRDYATTIETFVQRSFPKSEMKEIYGRNGKLVKWTLDIGRGVARPQTVHEHLEGLAVPLHPFMGCLGVAPPASADEPLTYFADAFGGNMDFYKVTAGATVYLPIYHDGALLFLGDGHAAQGDGEINGDALETSMDFSFVCQVIKGGRGIDFPRMEDADHLMALAMDKTMDLTLPRATQELVEWLQEDYKLSLREATQVVGPSIEYKITTLAGPKVVIAAMIRKDRLSGLTRHQP